jgi:hypothetical protein
MGLVWGVYALLVLLVGSNLLHRCSLACVAATMAEVLETTQD